MNTREYGRIARRLGAVCDLVQHAPEAERRFLDAGLDGLAMGRLAVRAAPMGEVGASTAAAVFYDVGPDLIASVIPRVWTLADPARLVSVRTDLVDTVLRRLAGDDGLAGRAMVEAASLARWIAENAVTTGRPLAAGNQDVHWPDQPHLVLWQALTVLREHRWGGRVAVLIDAELSGIESLVLSTAAWGARPDRVCTSRGWPRPQWDAAVAELRERGLLEPDGDPALTPDGRDLHERIETDTDRLGTDPWAAIGPGGAARLDDVGGWLQNAARAAGGFGLAEGGVPRLTRIC